MIYTRTVRGREASHDVTLSVIDFDYALELKIATGHVVRRYLIAVCNSMEPKIGQSRYHQWVYEVLQDTQHPEWDGRYCTEKQIVVVGLFGYRKVSYDGNRKVINEWRPFIEAEPSRREFLQKLRYYQTTILDMNQKAVLLEAPAYGGPKVMSMARRIG